jgi:hypothetical protein
MTVHRRKSGDGIGAVLRPIHTGDPNDDRETLELVARKSTFEGWVEDVEAAIRKTIRLGTFPR